MDGRQHLVSTILLRLGRDQPGCPALTAVGRVAGIHVTNSREPALGGPQGCARNAAHYRARLLFRGHRRVHAIDTEGRSTRGTPASITHTADDAGFRAALVHDRRLHAGCDPSGSLDHRRSALAVIVD